MVQFGGDVTVKKKISKTESITFTIHKCTNTCARINRSNH